MISFFPDATRGVIRSTDSQDISSAGINGIVVNAYHLTRTPGISVIKTARGIKQFMNWHGMVISDSGGFQLLSLVYANEKNGTISEKGITFIEERQGKRKKRLFTPEKSIQNQFAIGSDIMFCLDDCPPAQATEDKVNMAVSRTISWAKRCKEEFTRQMESRKRISKPRLFGVIQGGDSKKQRKRCADALEEIGFDGYGFGGWPLTSTGEFDQDIVSYVASAVPTGTPLFGLGIGHPYSIVSASRAGFTMFDCVLPTRDARHKRLYVFTKSPEQIDFYNDTSWFEYLYISDQHYVKDMRSVDPFLSDSPLSSYSRAYLHHLFSIGDALALRLATISNLFFYSQFIAALNNYAVKTR